MKHDCFQTQVSEIIIYSNVKNGRLLALCPDVEGFAAQAKDLDELKERIPPLMEALLQSRGESATVEFIEGVKPSEAISSIDKDFVATSMIAQAEICRAAA